MPNFTYVRIPAKDSESIVSLQADTSGGLTEDELVKQAKQYFFDQSGAGFRAKQLQDATPDQRRQLAAQIRQQMPAHDQQLKKLDDEALLNLLVTSKLQPSCDIVALTIPMSGNQYHAVSMYIADVGTFQENSTNNEELPLNHRAMALITSCGHGAREVRGDAFVGRALDNEQSDEWKRVDFLPQDVDPSASWCAVARRPGGGGGTGGSSASSLNNLVQQQSGGAPMLMNSDGGSAPQLFGMDGAPPVVEDWGSWTQSKEDVEIKFVVDSGTKARDCKVSFGRTSLRVVVHGKTLLEGKLFDPTEADEGTFTLQDVDGGRELCVTLVKEQTNRTWSLLIKK